MNNPQAKVSFARSYSVDAAFLRNFEY